MRTPLALLLGMIMPATLCLALPAVGASLTMVSGGYTYLPNGSSSSASISNDGRYAAFVSSATDLVVDDTNGVNDVFVHDRQTGAVVRVSVATGGAQANGASSAPSISGDGRLIAFTSLASNLVAGDTNGQTDVFVHDRQTGATTRVSVASDGAEANGFSDSAALSADGQVVAFVSRATNLVAGDTNNCDDIFAHDRQTGTTARVSVRPGGVETMNGSGAPAVSADGRYVAFESRDHLLVANDSNFAQDVFRHDRETGETILVSRSSAGVQGTNWAFGSAISGDGRFVAFWTQATEIVAGDTNGESDVFVYDCEMGETGRASVASDGTQANGYSAAASLSVDGRYVTFTSAATNLAPGDANGRTDVFRRDRQTGTTTRVTLTDAGGEPDADCAGACVSGDGRYVAFQTSAHGMLYGDQQWYTDVFVRDCQEGALMLASRSPLWRRASDGGTSPCVSADGRFVAYDSYAGNIVPGDTNNATDVFLYDRLAGTNTRVSIASDGAQGDDGSYAPAVSADGRYIAFQSGASTLVAGDSNAVTDVFVHDRATGVTGRVSVSSAGTQADAYSYAPAISADGRYVAFVSSATNLVPDDTNSTEDIFVHDRVTGTTTRVSVSSTGTQACLWSSHPSLSADGRYVAFQSASDDLAPGLAWYGHNVYVHDRQTHETRRISDGAGGGPANGSSVRPAISANGRYVAFASEATNLVPGDTNGVKDIFVCDTKTGQTIRVSVANGRVQSAGPISDDLAISADGRFVIFNADATDLVPGDTNNRRDTFIHDWTTATTRRINVSPAGEQASDHCWYRPSISGDGRFAAFASSANNLVPGDGGTNADIFLWNDRLTAVALALSPGTTAVTTSAIVLTAQPTGGTTPQYRFWYRRSTDSQYTMLRDWNANPAYGAWQPVAGTYRLMVQAREGTSHLFVTSRVMTMTVRPPFTNLTLAGSPPSPTGVGQRVVLAATATGGGWIEYAYTAQRGGDATPSFSRPFKDSRSTFWTPETPGTYTITVTARDVVDGTTRTATLTYAVAPSLSAVSMTAVSPTLTPGVLAPTTAVGVRVVLQATATGGGTVEYQLCIGYRATLNVPIVWTKPAYNFAAQKTYTPDVPGYYTFRIYARERGSTALYQVRTPDVSIQVKPAVSSYALQAVPSGSTPLGTTVQLAVTDVVGGANPLWKCWVKRKGAAQWTLLRDYEASTTFPGWTPNQAGEYEVMVYAKEVGSRAANYDMSRTFGYAITP